MNKRQEKKKFKKQYGVNPEQAREVIEKELPKLIEAITPILQEGIREMCTQAAAAMDTIKGVICEWAEKASEIAVLYANEVEVEDLIYRSAPLPREADTEHLVLKRVGFDKENNPWRFWYDPANDAWFGEIVKVR